METGALPERTSEQPETKLQSSPNHWCHGCTNSHQKTLKNSLRDGKMGAMESHADFQGFNDQSNSII